MFYTSQILGDIERKRIHIQSHQCWAQSATARTKRHEKKHLEIGKTEGTLEVKSGFQIQKKIGKSEKTMENHRFQ